MKNILNANVFELIEKRKSDYYKTFKELDFFMDGKFKNSIKYKEFFLFEQEEYKIKTISFLNTYPIDMQEEDNYDFSIYIKYSYEAYNSCYNEMERLEEEIYLPGWILSPHYERERDKELNRLKKIKENLENKWKEEDFKKLKELANKLGYKIEKKGLTL